MKKMRAIMMYLLITGCAMFMFSSPAAAADLGVDYSVAPILPDNQLDRGKSFFDLRVKPEEKQTIQLQIENYSDQEQRYFIEVNTAQTSGNLTIDYGNTDIPKDSINQQPISDYVKYPKEVTIPAKKAGVVSLDLTVPKESFDGILLGGIQVKKDFGKEEKPKDQISSEYAYVIGLMLSENDQPVEPDLQYKGIKAKELTNNAGLIVSMENPTPINIKKASLTADVYAEDGTKPVITRTIEDGGIAPSSRFDLHLFNGEAGDTKPLVAGKYRLELSVEDDAGHNWKFNEPFEITKKEASAVNNQVFQVEEGTNYWLYIIIGILAAVVLSFLGYFIYTKQKQKSNQ
ncbi:hypothetical protein IGI49_003496 [Enterococcus sp. AZ071]